MLNALIDAAAAIFTPTPFPGSGSFFLTVYVYTAILFSIDAWV